MQTAVVAQVFFRLQSESEIDARYPLLVAEGELVVASDVGEIIDGREASKEAVADLLDDRKAGGDDEFRESVVKGIAGVGRRERRLVVDNDGGQRREVDEPSAARHEVVAVAGTECVVGYPEVDLHVVGLHVSALCLNGRAEQETACRASLYVAV